MHDLNLTGHWAGIRVADHLRGLAYVSGGVRGSHPHAQVEAGSCWRPGLIWALIGVAYAQAGLSDAAHDHAAEMIGEYGELFLFLLVAITFVNTMEERRTFEVLRTRLVALGLGFRALFILTGVLSFSCPRFLIT